MKSYKDAKDYLENVFAPEREKVILDLINIRNDVQGVVKFHRFASMGYSYIGVLGGCAMFGALVVTGGASLFATGAFMGAYSSYAEVGHEAVAKTILITKFSDAETSLKEHEFTSFKMNELLGSLKGDIDKIDSLQSRIERLQSSKVNEQIKAAQILALIAQIAYIMGTKRDPKDLVRNRFEIYKLIKLGKLVEVVFLSGGRGISLAGKHGLPLLTGKCITKNVGKKTVKIMTTAFGVIADFHSFVTSIDDFKNLDEGKLCTEAERLNRIITEMQFDLKRIRECFENTST